MTLTPVQAPPPVTVPSVFARTPGAIVRTGWRRRWHLTPVWAGAVVYVAAHASPTFTVLTLAVLGGLAWRLSQTKNPRLWSARERRTASWWALAAAVWTVSTVTFPITALPSALLLAAATAWPSWRWITSRKVRRREQVAKEARQIAAAWGRVVTTHGSILHIGSRVIPNSLASPGDGAATFRVKLRWGVHGVDASTPQARRDAEVALGLPVDTLTITPDRSDSSVIVVAVSPKRHMETVEGIPWPGPVLLPDGRIPLAESRAGDTAHLRLYDGAGIKHWWISGPSAAGKSTLLGAVLTAAVQAPGGCVLLYADGGQRTSLPRALRPLPTTMAVTPAEWVGLIDTAHAVMVARMERRGTRDDIDSDVWVVGEEPDPIVFLILEEASTIARAVPQRSHEKVVEILEKGRKLGVGVMQLTQGTNGALLVGGVPAKTNLTQVAALRPQTSGNGRAAVDSAAGEIDLMTLPPQPGWCALVDTGQAAFPVRGRYATREALADATEGYEPLQFAGADAAAVDPELAEDEDDPETPEEALTSRDLLHRILTEHGPLSLGQIVHRDDWPLSRRQTSTHLTALKDAGAATKTGVAWTATTSEEQ